LDDESERFIHDVFDASVHAHGAQSKLVNDETRVASPENGSAHGAPHANGHSKTGKSTNGMLGRVASVLFGRRVAP
jgi:hypothetical protein